MDGRNTIIITLKWYFHVSENEISRFDQVCDLLLSGLIDGSYQRTPSFFDMEAEINGLARTFFPNSQRDLVTIQTDLWTILVNWWDAVKWARRGIRASMEKEDFLADLLSDIVEEIMSDTKMKKYFKPNVLQALIQMSTPPRYQITPFVRQRLPRKINLNAILKYYKQLSLKHGFGNEHRILLQLLFDKMTRNSERHTYFKVQEYRKDWRNSGRQPSFDDYISRRELTISPELLPHCKRLFEIKFEI